eukprot:402604_1
MASTDSKFVPSLGNENNGSLIDSPILDIEPKYIHFKQELTKNEICTLSESQWNNTAEEATIHIQSNKVKTMVCFRERSAHCYDMKYGDNMLMDHLIALKVYCSYDYLQRKFSETFRTKITRNDKYERLKSFINRHANYYWFARRLIECVECFGLKLDNNIDIIRVFHGVTKNFIFYSINAYITGPFSASTNYCVATNFSANTGVILEMCVDIDRWNMKPYGVTPHIQCMDMQWISDFPHEQELFFIYGFKPLVIQNIIDGSNGIAYSRYISGLRAFLQSTSSTINDDYPCSKKFSSKDNQVGFRLLSSEIYRYFPNLSDAHSFDSCPDYIKTTLQENCKDVVTLELMKEQDVIINYFFIDKKTHLIKLDLITTVFPNVRKLDCFACFGIQEYKIYLELIQNILDFVIMNKEKGNNLRLKAIKIIYLPKYKVELLGAVEMKYKDMFEAYSWSIMSITTIDEQCEQTRQNLKTRIFEQYGSMENYFRQQTFSDTEKHIYKSWLINGENYTIMIYNTLNTNNTQYIPGNDDKL